MDIERTCESTTFSKLEIGDTFTAINDSYYNIYMKIDRNSTNLQCKNVINLRNGHFEYCKQDEQLKKVRCKLVVYD